MEEQKKTQGIDKDVLDIMKKEDVDLQKATENDTMFKRVFLNCICEVLSVVKSIKSTADELNQILSIVSADKLNDYFREVVKGVEAEQNRAKVVNIVEKSHKKPKKSKKNTK